MSGGVCLALNTLGGVRHDQLLKALLAPAVGGGGGDLHAHGVLVGMLALSCVQAHRVKGST